jgi:6-phosphogluconolactonase
MTDSERYPDSRRPMMYDLEQPSLPRPPLRGEVVVRPTDDELVDILAADLVIHAENCVRQFGDFHLALSGDRTFELLYRRLMYDPNYRRLPWRRTHLWFVEEHCIGFEDERSSFRLLNDILADHADIPDEQFHPIFASTDDAAAEYERQLKDVLGWREKGQDRLDYVLLTIGDDGRTAGLFPGSAVLEEKRRFVRRSTSTDAETMDCVTLTAPLLNAARFVAVYVTGAEKAEAVRRLAEDDEPVERMPIRGIEPVQGELRWYLDAAACGIEL